MRLLDPASYVYNPYAVPQLVCGLAALVFGIFIVLRERASRVGVLYLFLALAIGTWFLGFGAGYLSREPELADRWTRFAHIGISFIPALTLQFMWSVVRPAARLNWLLWIGWIGAGVFAVCVVAVPQYFGEPYRHFWGYYGRYTAYGSMFVLFLVTLYSVALVIASHAYRRAHRSSVANRRAKLLFVVFALGAFGMVDFLPAYGFNFYPFGYVPVLIGVGLMTYITSRYRLVDITPEFAAKQIIETMNDGLFVLDNERIIRVANDPLLNMLGLKREQVIGQRIPESMRRLLAHSEIAALQRGEPLHNREIDFKRADGTPIALSLAVSVTPERGNQNVAYVCVLRDITERKHAEQRIRFLAYYDSLTSLPNRQMFQDQLRAALANAARNKRMAALLFLDLDHFKRINDTLGHALGDELLQAVAGRLLGCVRKTRLGVIENDGTVARLGGDEFIVALHDLEKQEDAARVAERVLAAVSKPIHLDKHEIAVTASIGISVYPHDGEDVGALLKSADVAMYQAKAAGRNSYFFYDQKMNVATHDRLSIETKLRRALEHGHLSLHYQPIVATHSLEPVGVEALLRWDDPELGSVPPERFISIAEESGLIRPIGEWVLRTACASARAWQDAGLAPLRMAVNLSGRQFYDRDLAVIVRDALDDARLEPHWLELELTESMIMQDALHTRSTLDVLRAMGVRFSIDDFGTGYSSLSYLRSFPIDMLKIDRSFVHDISAMTDSGAIVAAIIALARSLQLGVIAEGVDREEQLAFLKLHGCKLAQGFLFCKPLPAAELQVWMQRRHLRIAK